METMQNWLEGLLRDSGIEGVWLPYLKLLILLIGLTLLAYLVFVITKWIVLRLVHSFLLRTNNKWDDVLVEHKVFKNLAHIVPAIIVKALAPLVFADFENLLPFIIKVTDIYIVLVIMTVVVALMRGIEFFLTTSPVFKNKPVASYFQLARIVIYIATAILALSILMGQSPVYFLSAFGAISAVVLLIFKDTILGLVASVQISANDMIRVGDWVEMPKFNADGDVLAINLNTVKIKNWDKTVTTVPTYYFIQDSFKNWRGMQESGGRRIKRSVFINLRSIKFVDEELRERFKRFYIINDYVSQRQLEIDQHNQSHTFDASELINGRRMTNIGVFREYVISYLKKHKGINQGMTILVRQLQPDANGLPIEIYCFTKSIAWLDYEEVQSDIFDHLLAAASHFDLDVFQNPAGNDIVAAGKLLSESLSK